VSFCLVVYYNNISRLVSGLLTVFTNRLGDVMFLVVFYFLFLSGTNLFTFMFYKTHPLLIILMMFGALTKSAQIPFSSWLPAAIAAPTPVSSLVHSSTLVTAGVYVLIRFNNIFSSYIARFSFLFVITIFFAGLGACLENDIKKVVAMSTLRQLSFIILCISLEK